MLNKKGLLSCNKLVRIPWDLTPTTTTTIECPHSDWAWQQGHISRYS